MHIRLESFNDHEQITALQYAAFKNHPHHEPGSEPVEQRIVELLREQDHLALSLVAEDSGRLVGHIAYSPAVVGNDGSGWLLMGPVGVLPEVQSRGIGSALIGDSLDQLRAVNALGVVLVGDPDFYGRFGFRRFPDLTYPGVPGQFVLGLSFTGRQPTGEILADRAFSMAMNEAARA